LIPKYVKTNASHCWYTRDWHLHAWSGRAFVHKASDKTKRSGVKRGISLKHRVRENLWKHYSISAMKYDSHERGCGEVRHFEIAVHDSRSVRGDRVRKSKRYVRFKVCL
jgi:hypothetical protein